MLAYLFVILAVVMKFFPQTHPWAFTPVAAALLFFGARASRRYAWIPLGLLMATDLVLTLTVYRYPFSLDHLVTWAWYAAILWLGGYLRQDSRPRYVVGASLVASVSFFLASNFAVWACWNMYPKTMGGLGEAYVAGLPFFRNAAAGDLFFAALMFGVGALVAAHSPGRERTTA